MMGKVEYGSFFDFERRYKEELLEGTIAQWFKTAKNRDLQVRSLIRSHRSLICLLRTARFVRLLRCVYLFARSLTHSRARGESEWSDAWTWGCSDFWTIGEEDRRDHVFHTSYETLKANPKKEIAEMGRFLGIERSDDFYDQVVEATSFQKIKEIRDQDHRYPWHRYAHGLLWGMCEGVVGSVWLWVTELWNIVWKIRYSNVIFQVFGSY